MDKHTRIAIIGAGIAGLNAALTLQDAGLACSIYEASNRIGGRMHSDTTTWADGMVSEWCGEFIDGDHRTLLHLIERFRLKTIDLGREIPERAQTIMYFFNAIMTRKKYGEAFDLSTLSCSSRFRKRVFRQLIPTLRRRDTGLTT